MRILKTCCVLQIRQTNYNLAVPTIPKMPVQPKKFTGRMFSIQEALPKFPVAPLEQTLEKYLQTVQPLVTDAEFQKTQQVSLNRKFIDMN